MRVAIVGAQGTGKTTLAHDLSLSLELRVLPEVARLAKDAGFGIDEKATFETEIWIAAKQLELENFYNNWIADRCLIDLFAYVKCLFPLDGVLRDVVETLLVKQLKRYEYVIYLPVEFPLVGDGVRNVDKEFQDSIDSFIKEVMDDLEVPYYVVTGNPTERLLRVQEILGV